MCTVCGCSDGKPVVEQAHEHHRKHGNDGIQYHHGCEHSHRHHHQAGAHHDHMNDGAGLNDCSANPAGQQIARIGSERIIQVERDILGKNDRLAANNRACFRADDVLAFNLVSSPGAGKTSLLVRAVSELKGSFPIGVIEGDQQTSNDAERIRATGLPAIQVNTGKGCHLDAAAVGEAYERLPWLGGGILFIENVGNLVCPAAFDLGEACKIVVLSTTEGEDKPLKYPDMFAASSLMMINKIDLAKVLDFDLARTIEYAHRVNSEIEILTVSARTGEGFPAFYDWIRKQAFRAKPAAKTVIE
ncbi:hydrogenase nickel incorporation protein HypB [Bradyrhizobium sp. CIAT3101]|uniref:hydrogenase nickel incorporation protein HypB n=1 Tax=Bradyrhizobium sp. CIAT3101 TaxID=439387 RepID=UPI0024B0549F|nr:hydrogenase nickel incorporation protein HypB [Bradyrhizobium sp. CIAT3101]WFU80382.1 hydrogenase nickel incorporation protein HypB [Bradyrhizobium sp. CIAT3101]